MQSVATPEQAGMQRCGTFTPTYAEYIS